MEISTLAQTSNERFLPKDYSVNAPIGEFEARLDFRQFTVGSSRRCFFTHLGTGEKFSLIAYRPGWLTDDQPKSDINFMADAAITAQNVFTLVTEENERGHPVWKSAKLVSEQIANSEV